MSQTVGRIYAVGALCAIVLFVYVCVFKNQVPFTPFTQLVLSVAAFVASCSSRNALLPEHKIIPGQLNPFHIRLYLSGCAYFFFWLTLFFFIALFVAGIVTLGDSTQEQAVAFVLLLSGWWLHEFYFAAALLLLGTRPSPKSQS